MQTGKIVAEHQQCSYDLTSDGTQEKEEPLDIIVTHAPLAAYIEAESTLEGTIGRLDGGQLLELDPLPRQSVLSVSQLDQLLYLVTHGAVILHHHALHGLDQTPLDVA